MGERGRDRRRARPHDRGDCRRARRRASATSTSPVPPPGPPASASSTGCSAAGSCRAPSCSSPASRGSASRRCCSTWPRVRPGPAPRCSTSVVRSRPPRCAAAPSASTPSPTPSTSRPRPTSRRCSATSRRAQPDLLVVDSVQTVASAEIEGQAGNVSQVREVAASLIRAAKQRGMAVLLVGHVTKDGSIAGPPRARAPRRRRRAVRGRPALPAAPRPRGQEPLRPHRRGRLLRPVRHRHRRPARPERTLPHQARPRGGRHLRHGDARGPPAPRGRGAGARRPVDAARARGAPPAASTRPGWP